MRFRDIISYEHIGGATGMAGMAIAIPLFTGKSSGCMELLGLVSEIG